MAVTYKEYHCMSMLRVHKYVDNWFWGSASVSPYKACEHGCNYCDGRSQKYHASEDFDQEIHVKINGPEVLRKELTKLFPPQKKISDFVQVNERQAKRIRTVVMVSSGISDAYQPAERKYKLTREILKLLAEYRVPTFVMTKSDLILRDLDLLEEINDRSWCNVSFSVSTLNKNISRVFEPKTSPPKRRLDAMKIITEKGILAGITYIPIIPYITDTDEQLSETIETSKKYGARYILGGTMTLRDVQARRFYEILKEHYPELVDKYKKLYMKGYEPLGKYIYTLNQKIKALCRKYDIQNYIPRYIPDIELKKNLKVSTMLFLCAYFLSFEEKGHYRAKSFRRLGQTIEDMNENIVDIYQKGKLEDIKGMGVVTKKLIEEFLETGSSEYLEELKR
jgi:DNA repair photolyase